METIFESKDIRFVPICEQLVPDYLTMVNDYDNVAHYIGDRTEPYTVEQEMAFVRRKLAQQAPIFSMLQKGTDLFIGNIELMHMVDGAAELGIAITASMQNKGYGTQAIRAIVRYGMTVLDLRRIYLAVFVHNARAIHVYQRCGFVEYKRDERDIWMQISAPQGN